MSRVADINERYSAIQALARNGVGLFVVADASGTRLNDSIRAIARMALDDGNGLWDNLLGAAKLLRWRLAFRPQPLEFNPSIGASAAAVLTQADIVRAALGREGSMAVNALTAAVREVASSDPPVGPHLLDAILETGAPDCVVVTDGTLSRDEVGLWLEPFGVRVLSPGMLAEKEVIADITYVVGPPRLMRTSLVTAPATAEVSFFVPSWFTDRTLPRTVLADYAEGAIRPPVRVFALGEIAQDLPKTDDTEPERLEDFLPPPAWGEHSSILREPGVDEVTVRKVLLSGGYAIWMDDGDRIRTLDPSQLAGERVNYTEVRSVKQGTYLMLRLGSTERAALYEQTLLSIGGRGDAIKHSQAVWKSRLLERLHDLGRTTVESTLRHLGVNAVEQALAWTDPTLARPQRDEDFWLLLRWLELSHEPTFSNATEFRRARSRAAARIREQLEEAMSGADMDMLRREGHVTLEGAGFSRIIAARVLAISPHVNVVMRHDAREPFPDEGGQWLE
jgi:hypothetical protein